MHGILLYKLHGLGVYKFILICRPSFDQSVQICDQLQVYKFVHSILDYEEKHTHARLGDPVQSC